MAIKKVSVGGVEIVITTRMEFAETFEGFPVPGGLVEHVRVDLPRNLNFRSVDETNRLKLVQNWESERAWNTGKFPVSIEDVPTLDVA
jgi:hypothetical protein